MRTARWEFWPAFLTTWRGEVPACCRQAGEDGQVEARAARAGNTACRVFHELRVTKHESQLLRPLCSPWGRKGRITRTRRPDRRTRCPVTAPLSTMAGHDTDIPQMCAESRLPQKNHCLPARCCPRWSDMARGVGCEPVSAHRQCFASGLTTSAVCRRSRRPPGSCH